MKEPRDPKDWKIHDVQPIREGGEVDKLGGKGSGSVRGCPTEFR